MAKGGCFAARTGPSASATAFFMRPYSAASAGPETSSSSAATDRRRGLPSPLEGEVPSKAAVRGRRGRARRSLMPRAALTPPLPLCAISPARRKGGPSNTSATFAYVSISLANQPNVSSEGASGIAPSSEMRAWVVRSPTSPQKLAGARIEPPVSEPTAISTSPPATAAAEPDDEPPVTRSGALGFTGCGKCTFWPVIAKASSSVWVLPAKRAPASSNICTAGAVLRAGGSFSALSGLPQPVT